MPIVFTSTPLPANGSPRTAASEAAIFSNIANTYNTYETSVNGSLTTTNVILAARGSTAVGGNIAQRDVNADIFFRDTYGRSFVGSGIFYGGALAKPFTDINGYIRADALPVIPSYLIDQLNPVGVVALRIDWTVGYVTDTTGQARQVAAGNKTYNDIPIPTNAYWATTYVDKTTGTVTTTYAAAPNSVTPSTTLPANCRSIADVYLPANAAGIIVPKSLWAGGTQPFFLDGRQRDPAMTPGGGGGGGAAVFFASVLAPVGSSDASMLASTGVTTPFNIAEWLNGTASGSSRNGIIPANLRVKESLIAVDSTQGTLEDALSLSVTGNIDGAIQFFSNFIRIKVPSGQPPITFKSGGKRFTVFDTTAALDTPTIAVADVGYTLYANVATATFTLASTPPTGNYIPIKDYLWDGSTFYTEKDRVKPVLNSLSLSKISKSMLYADVLGLAATGGSISDVASGTAGMITFLLPPGNWRAQVRGTARYQSPATIGTAPDVRLYIKSSTGKAVALAGGAAAFGQLAPPVASTVASLPCAGLFENLSGGYQNFGLGYYYFVSGSPGVYNLLSPYIEAEISRM